MNKINKAPLNRLFNVLLFAALFSVVGHFLPQIYFRYFDKTDYYKIYSPVAINQSIVYKPCGTVEVSFTKESLIQTNGTVDIALNLIKADGMKKRVGYQVKEIPLTLGEDVIITSWNIDCSAVAGEYYFEGVLTYRVNGLEKGHGFFSEKFKIVN